MFITTNFTREAKLAVESLLFDAAYYASQRGDEIASGTSPISHYLSNGMPSGCAPHPLFDPQYYVCQKPKIDTRIGNALMHYISAGPTNKRSPHPLFDAEYFLRQHDRVDEAVLTPLSSYLASGTAGGANPNEFFDTNFYLQQVPELIQSGMNPLVHYLLVGAAKGLDPGPSFHTDYYLKQNPDVARSQQNPLIHYLTFGRYEGRSCRSPFVFTRLKAEERTVHEKAASADYMRLRRIEPLLPTTNAVSNSEELSIPLVSRAGEAYFKLLERLDRPFSHLFLMPFLIRGGAEKVTMNMVKCVADKTGTDAPVVIVVDDNDVSALDWLPGGVRLIVMDDLEPNLRPADKMLVLLRLIMQARPCAVTNTNSLIGWNLYAEHARQLKQFTHLAACLFDYGYDSENIPDGFAVHHLNKCMDYLTFVFSDNDQFQTKLLDRFAFGRHSRDKFVVMHSPLPIDAAGLQPPRTSRLNREVLWASRLSHGKRPDILLAIAKRLPHVKFNVWGKPDNVSPELLRSLMDQQNIAVCGGYASFTSIPLEKAGVFLYTTQSDGIPLVLLEAMAAGLPVIAPDIGGISELISAETGWLLNNHEDVEAYATAIEQILGAPELAIVRVKQATELLRVRHLWASFANRLNSAQPYWEREQSNGA